MPILISDNFFYNPDKIRHYAFTLKYDVPSHISGWKGFRSFSNDMELLNCFKSKLIKIQPNLEFKNFRYYFHYSTKETESTCYPSFNEYKIHKDTGRFAGVVYLSPNPKENSGTCFYGDNLNLLNCVDNVYNRLVLYPANIFHAPENLFGNSLSTGRLVLTFFL